MDLNTFYREILKTGYLSADDDGRISGQVGSIPPTPVTIEGKRLVLPTKENLNLLDKSGIVIFHPLQEDSLKGESAVLVKFRSMVNLRINYVIGSLMESLFHVITSPAMHKKLSPTQSEILTAVSKADAATAQKPSEVMTQFSSLLKAMQLGDKDKYFAYICLTKGGSAGGVTYNRFASVTSPFLDELNSGEKKVFGVTLSPKTKESIKQLLEYILPGLGVQGTYNRGSSADIAPFTVALLKALLGLAEKTNQVTQNFAEFISKIEEMEYVGEWPNLYEDLMFLQNDIRMVPMQNGNNTPTLSAPVAVARAAQPVQLTPQMQPQMVQQVATPFQQQQPQVQQNPTVASFTTADGQFDFAKMLRSTQQPQQMQMPMMMPGQMMVPGMVAQPMMQPMLQQPMMMPQGMVMQQPMMVSGQMMQPMMMQPQMQPSIPRFAQAAVAQHNAAMMQQMQQQPMMQGGYGMMMPGYGTPPGSF